MGSGGRVVRSSGVIDAVEHLSGNAMSPPDCIIGIMNGDTIGSKASRLFCRRAAIAQSRRAQYLPGSRRTFIDQGSEHGCLWRKKSSFKVEDDLPLRMGGGLCQDMRRWCGIRHRLLVNSSKEKDWGNGPWSCI
ncbi:hypothetical protein OG21DRAFT_1524750 [Imleria badia]|nr:hypothetical protein OG21DRAFT_1524750 [Imleria badia]